MRLKNKISEKIANLFPSHGIRYTVVRSMYFKPHISTTTLNMNYERRIYSSFRTAKQIIKELQSKCSLQQGYMYAFKIQTLISWRQLIQAKYRRASEGKYVYTSSTSYLLLYITKYNLCCKFSKTKCIFDLRNETSANYILSAAYNWPQTSSHSELQYSSGEETHFPDLIDLETY